MLDRIEVSSYLHVQHIISCMHITLRVLQVNTSRVSLGTPSRRRVSWGTHTLHFSNPLLFIYIVVHTHSFSASITYLDRSFLYTYTLLFLWKGLALKSKGFPSFFLVVCSSSSKHSLLVLQVSDLIERTLGCPKDIHTTPKGPPRGLAAFSQPYLSSFHHFGMFCLFFLLLSGLHL